MFTQQVQPFNHFIGNKRILMRNLVDYNVTIR
jgi:hypothetical protein